MKKIFFVLSIIFFANVVSGDVALPPSYYYQLHLYYNNGAITTDRDYKYSYDVIPGTYTNSELRTEYPYIGEVVSVKGVKLMEVEFDPGVQLSGKTIGKLTVVLPYFANAKDVNIYDNNKKVLLSISVSETSFCNDDTICDSDIGENYINCANDCKGSSLVAPSPSPTIIPGIGKTSSLLSAIMYILGGIIIVGGYFGWRWYQKRNINNITIQ